MEADAGGSDAFDTIVMAETRFHGEGYQEGYAEGTRVGLLEGRQYGIQQGAKIGLEIGSYLGFAMTWQKLLHKGSDEKNSGEETLCAHGHHVVSTKQEGFF
ncbi:Yae1_N domain-containing protein [Podarcis lilfordi]|uniref:Yae1_N domain-containing protein n=1 Tax=Podarcis lilfordi TaxID=74358 RepID=A0AA35NTK9_9SAUR|nr:Yae1_N domain-containing protein [Podarcis lilfordi]